MRVLVACDKFKDSLTATEACDVIATAIRQRRRDATVVTCPITDGGDGFTAVLTQAAGGETRPFAVRGPRGTAVNAAIGFASARNLPDTIRERWGFGSGDTIAIIAMADASGLALLPAEARDVWQTDTFGTGELIRTAADAGANAIMLGIGGSATNDLGIGALTALGLTLRDARGATVAPAPVNWSSVARLAGAIPPLPRILIACDVTNPLLGPNGAAAVYGVQKGLRPQDVTRLDHASGRMALLLCGHFSRPDSWMDERGAGAAGGLGFGLRVAAGAELVRGFELVCEWLELDRRIREADVVITGEGRFDESSAHGKGPAGVVDRALAAGKAVHVLAGEITGSSTKGRKLSAHAITPSGTPLQRALLDARANLAAAVDRVFG